jgi:hypothetical protein
MGNWLELSRQIAQFYTVNDEDVRNMMYLIQHYVVKVGSDLRKVGAFFSVYSGFHHQ